MFLAAPVHERAAFDKRQFGIPPLGPSRVCAAKNCSRLFRKEKLVDATSSGETLIDTTLSGETMIETLERAAEYTLATEWSSLYEHSIMTGY